MGALADKYRVKPSLADKYRVRTPDESEQVPGPGVLAPETKLGATGAGVAQGMSLGFGDELLGASELPEEIGRRLGEQLGTRTPRGGDADPATNQAPAVVTKSWGAPSAPAVTPSPELPPVRPSLASTYRAARDKYRAMDTTAEQAHPALYKGSELLAGLAMPLPGGGAATGASLATKIGKGALTAGALGTLIGAGRSEADTAGGVLKDAAKSGLVAAPLGAASTAAGIGAGKLASRFGGKATALETGLRADRVAEDTASAQGAYGHSVQDANRNLENIRTALADPGSSPQLKANLRKFMQTPEYAQLVEQVGQNTLDAAPLKLGKMAAAKQAVADAPALANKAVDELLERSVLKDKVLPRLAHYGKPAAAALIGGMAGGPVGAESGAVIGAALGKPGRSAANLWKDPVFQIHLNRSLKSGTEAAGNALQSLGPAAAAQAGPADSATAAELEKEEAKKRRMRLAAMFAGGPSVEGD